MWEHKNESFRKFASQSVRSKHFVKEFSCQSSHIMTAYMHFEINTHRLGNVTVFDVNS